MYPSNLTLEGPVRAVYVLNSCEFMYEGRLQSLHYYASSLGWFSVQVWRPVKVLYNKRTMKLIYEREIETIESSRTIQVKNVHIFRVHRCAKIYFHVIATFQMNTDH